MVKTFKKILNYAPASIGAATTSYLLVHGVDSIAPGQGGVTDSTVPTGCTIKRIVVQMPVANLAAAACIFHVAVQFTLQSQTAIAANVVGGNPQRNQVIHQSCRSLGQGQNGSLSYVIKVPKQFQRVKEDMKWFYTVTSSATSTQAMQVIYTMLN